MSVISNRRAFLKAAGLTTAAAFARPALAGEAPPEPAAGTRIVAGPYLQNVTPDGATVMWITDKPCVSWVDYGASPDMRHRLQDSHDGLIDAYETVHRIRITGLTPGQPCYYRATSREITLFNPYQVDFGASVQSEIIEFTPPRADAAEVDFVVFNDVHQNPETWKRIHAVAAQEPFDLLVANGDLIGHIHEHDPLVQLFLEPCTTPLGGARPFVFVRGNHEARGKFARHLPDYFDLPNGGYYHAFTWGPVHFLVLDGGEDKSDESNEYFGLVNFEPYLRKQAEWVAEQVKTEAFQKAPFRVVLCHIPLRAGEGGIDYRAPIVAALNGAGVDLSISGHTHTPAYLEPEAGRDYPIVIGGGNEPEQATVIRINADRDTMHMRMLKTDGTVLEDRKYASRKK